MIAQSSINCAVRFGFASQSSASLVMVEIVTQVAVKRRAGCSCSGGVDWPFCGFPPDALPPLQLHLPHCLTKLQCINIKQLYLPGLNLQHFSSFAKVTSLPIYPHQRQPRLRFLSNENVTDAGTADWNWGQQGLLNKVSILSPLLFFFIQHPAQTPGQTFGLQCNASGFLETFAIRVEIDSTKGKSPTTKYQPGSFSPKSH